MKFKKMKNPKAFLLGLVGFLIAFPITFLAEMNLGPLLSNLARQVYSSLHIFE